MENELKTMSGNPIFPIGFGTMPISDFYPPFPLEEESMTLLQGILDYGINLIDTAMVYGDGYCEKLVGKAYEKSRGDVFIVSKCGLFRQDGGYVFDGRPERIKADCHASLKYFQTDCIDAYLLHRVDPNVPIEESVQALAELKQQQLIRYIGISEVDGDTLERALKAVPIDFVQNEYSMMSRASETDGTFACCEKHNINFMAYSPIGRGFFTRIAKQKQFSDIDKNDIRNILPRFQGQNLQKNLKLLDELEKIAQDKKCTLPQLALAWLLAQAKKFNVNIYPIPGSKHLKHIQENADAANIYFTDHELVQINAIIGNDVFLGARWPEQQLVQS